MPSVWAGGVAAFGVPTAAGGRLVIAVETIGVPEDVLQRAVTAAVLDEAGFSPADVAVLPPRRLPKTSSGKLRRGEVRRRYEAGELV